MVYMRSHETPTASAPTQPLEELISDFDCRDRCIYGRSRTNPSVPNTSATCTRTCRAKQRISLQSLERLEGQA